MFNLNEIKDSSFVKNLSNEDKIILANTIREFLINNISKTGGHLASNLGVIELTIALHACFDLEKDKLIFDVSHQTYTHKILTGRANNFNTLRQLNGLSGYSSKKESKYDFYETGHSSTSISAQSGILEALSNESKDDYVVSVIGDAALSNGMSFEALNFIGEQKYKKCIIILNDNKMGIGKTVGALSKSLNKYKLTKLETLKPCFLKIKKNNIFNDLGITYLGPVDGHNIKDLIKNINYAKSLNKPVLVHVLTKKGKGYKDAEFDIDGDFHGVSANFKNTENDNNSNISYSLAVSQSLEKYMDKYNDLYVISSGMIKGSMLNNFQKKYPKNIIDVGIAEEHAATMTSGLAMMNKKIFLSYYSTFSQRAYDQINHDILRQNLKCVIGLDRSGIVGEDGQTHQGIYDLSIFNPLDCYICNPYNQNEIDSILEYAYSNNCDKTVFLRFPRGYIENNNLSNIKEITKPSWYYFNKTNNAKICFISYGSNLNIFNNVKNNLNLDIDIINALFIKPLDNNFINEIFDKYDYIFTLEEVIYNGSLSESLVNYLYQNNMINNLNKLYIKLLDNTDIPFGKINDVKKAINLDEDKVLEWVKSIIK